MNPFFSIMGNQRPNMMQQFQSFMQQMKGKDPNAIINEMVSSGKLTQEQLNQAQQQAQQMRDGLKKGDTITTIGGIIGKVVSIDKDTFVIETSEDRVRVQFAKWALSTVGVQTGEQPEAKKKEESAATEGADSSTPAEVPAETTSETDEEK